MAKRVVTIGGATAERVLVVDPRSFRPGGKHTLPPQRLLAGGSAINQACRLLAAGTDVEPIVPLCRDPIGDLVVRALRDAARRGGAHLAAERVCLEGEELSTPLTTITVIGGERTIYTEFADDLFAPFEDHLENRLAALDEQAGAVLVGHVHADRAGAPGRGGRLTRRIVSIARAKDVPVFVNLGSAQYRLGLQAFASVLADVACLQLDIEEMRAFLGGNGSRPALSQILDAFRDRCTVIVTLERMGAVGQRKGSSNIVLTWPYQIDAIDTTGAGDAFAAGVVSAMLRWPLADDEALARAMDRGGLFAAHACLTPGGADRCPTAVELEEFRAANTRMLDTEVTTLHQAGRVLRLLDQVFSR